MDLSNKNLIIIAKVTDETIYFYNYLDYMTTVILVTNPSCSDAEKAFVYLMCDKNCTLIKLNEPETTSNLSAESILVITTILKDCNFERIMTLNETDGFNNPLNKQIYGIVHDFLPKKHFTYEIGAAVPLCGRRKALMEIYSNACKDKYKELAKNATFINTIKPLLN